MASRPRRTMLPALLMWLNTRRSMGQISTSGTLRNMTRSARCRDPTVQFELQRYADWKDAYPYWTAAWSF